MYSQPSVHAPEHQSTVVFMAPPRAGSIQSPGHNASRALLDAASDYDPADSHTPHASSHRPTDLRFEESQQGYEQDDADGEEDQDYDQDGDDTDGQHTDGGRGAISEPDACGGSRCTGYHSADGTIHHHHARHRMPRIRAVQQRAPLSFGGPTRRASVPTPRGNSNIRRGQETSGSQPAQERCSVRGTTLAAAEEESSGNDPLVWRGHATPPLRPLIPQSSFGLPPLLADMGEPRTSHPHANGGLNGSHQQPIKLLRCTSYCCSLGLDLLALHRHLAEGRGLACRMHKDGLNAVVRESTAIPCAHLPAARPCGAPCRLTPAAVSRKLLSVPPGSCTALNSTVLLRPSHMRGAARTRSTFHTAASSLGV